MDRDETEAGFNYIYENNIKNKLYKFEAQRLVLKKRYDFLRISAIVLPIISCILLFLIRIFEKSFYIEDSLYIIFVVVFVLGIISGVIFGVLSQNISDNFRKSLKTEILSELISVFGEWNISESEIISLQDIHSLGFFKYATSKEDDDVINIQKSVTEINITESKLTHTTGGKYKTTITDFDGLIFKIKIRETFRGLTKGQLRSGDYSNNFIMGSTILSKEINLPAFLKRNKEPEPVKIRAGSVKFNNYFDIYSTNASESDFLITPEFEETLFYIKQSIPNQSIDFAFYNGCLFIFLNQTEYKRDKINQNGYFEVGSISESLYNPDIYKKLYLELYLIGTVLEKYTGEYQS